MKHEIELHPFSVPNFVRQVEKPGRRQDGFKDSPGIPLSDLSVETLDAMCEQFKRDVFKKAGKEQPTTAV